MIVFYNYYPLGPKSYVPLIDIIEELKKHLGFDEIFISDELLRSIKRLSATRLWTDRHQHFDIYEGHCVV